MIGKYQAWTEVQTMWTELFSWLQKTGALNGMEFIQSGFASVLNLAHAWPVCNDPLSIFSYCSELFHHLLVSVGLFFLKEAAHWLYRC